MDSFDDLFIGKSQASAQEILDDMLPLFAEEFREAGFNYEEMVGIYTKIMDLLDGNLQFENFLDIIELKSDIVSFLVFFEKFSVKFLIDVVSHDESEEMIKIRRQVYDNAMRKASMDIVDRERRTNGMPKRGSPRERELIKMVDEDGKKAAAEAIVEREIMIGKSRHLRIGNALKKIFNEFTDSQFESSVYAKAVVGYLKSLHAQWKIEEGGAKIFLASQINREIGLIYISTPIYRRENLLEKFRPIEQAQPEEKKREQTPPEKLPVMVDLQIAGSRLTLQLDSITKFLSGKLSLEPEVLERIGKTSREIMEIINSLLNTPANKLNEKIKTMIKANKRFGQVDTGTGIVYVLQDKSQKNILCKIAFRVGEDKKIQIQFLTNELKEIPIEILEG